MSDTIETNIPSTTQKTRYGYICPKCFSKKITWDEKMYWCEQRQERRCTIVSTYARCNECNKFESNEFEEPVKVLAYQGENDWEIETSLMENIKYPEAMPFDKIEYYIALHKTRTDSLVSEIITHLAKNDVAEAVIIRYRNAHNPLIFSIDYYDKWGNCIIPPEGYITHKLPVIREYHDRLPYGELEIAIHQISISESYDTILSRIACRMIEFHKIPIRHPDAQNTTEYHKVTVLTKQVVW